MATQLTMPQMGYDMQEGTLVRWLQTEGAEVSMGDAIAEIETDKAIVEFESTESGVLRRLLVHEGTTVPVGQPIAIVGAADEEIPDTLSEAPAAESERKEASGIPLPPPAAPVAEPPRPVDAVRASPVARRLAAERGVDLSTVRGSGPGGRITKDDVLAAEAATPAVEAPAAPAPGTGFAEVPPPPSAVAPPAAGEKVPLTRMRQQIARVTVRSKGEIPHFYVSAEIDMSEAMALRRRLNESLEDQGVRVTVNDMIIAACVKALKLYPKFNATFAEDGVQMNAAINVGIAIAEQEGLIVPAIMDCGNKSLAEIAAASKDLAVRSKSGTLHAQEYTGGTFSTSNLGMFDVSYFIAIIQPPQSAVLAVGSVSKRPVVRDDKVAIAEIMTATLSADHRVVDGAEGARFLGVVKQRLEQPLSLLL